MHIMMLIGSPGCGKGTLSTHLQRQGYHAVSTGELPREAAKHDPALAGQLASGTLTDDQKITDLLRAALEDQTQVLLDGYPPPWCRSACSQRPSRTRRSARSNCGSATIWP